jgi:hypothetical protein
VASVVRFGVPRGRFRSCGQPHTAFAEAAARQSPPADHTTYTDHHRLTQAPPLAVAKTTVVVVLQNLTRRFQSSSSPPYSNRFDSRFAPPVCNVVRWRLHHTRTHVASFISVTHAPAIDRGAIELRTLLSQTIGFSVPSDATAMDAGCAVMTTGQCSRAAHQKRALLPLSSSSSGACHSFH